MISVQKIRNITQQNFCANKLHQKEIKNNQTYEQKQTHIDTKTALTYLGQTKKNNNIISDTEYSQLLDKLKKLNINGNNLKSSTEYTYTSDMPKKFEGLCAYTMGIIDYDLNKYLSGREFSKDLSKNDLDNYIKVFEYSLNKLDETFPPYNGIVYRGGQLSTNGGRYFSCSKDMDNIVNSFNIGRDNFEIIISKKGHDIDKFQSYYVSDDLSPLLDESEVLFDKTSKFQEITTPDENLSQLKLKFADKLFDTDKNISKYMKLPQRFISIDDAFDKIKIYKEI